MAWYFIRIARCRSITGARLLQSVVRVAAGPVYECEYGTEADPDAGWFVVKTSMDVSEIRKNFDKTEIGSRVERIERIERLADGRALARQLSLF